MPRQRRSTPGFLRVDGLDWSARVMGVLGSRPDGQQVIDRMDRRTSARPGFAGLRIHRQAATFAG